MQEMNKISHKNIAIADADSLFILKEDTKMVFFLITYYFLERTAVAYCSKS